MLTLHINLLPLGFACAVFKVHSVVISWDENHDAYAYIIHSHESNKSDFSKANDSHLKITSELNNLISTNGVIFAKKLRCTLAYLSNFIRTSEIYRILLLLLEENE